jgi:predicted adenylyl cyclase CyaB
MPRNVEIKARVADPQAVAERAARVSDGGPWTIEQDDAFFACEQGRLKLRDFGDGRGELIYYRRADLSGPGRSEYRITPTADPAGLRGLLGEALGAAGRVRKRRVLYRAGRTRIHLDRVEGLGDFVELEVVLEEDEDEAAGVVEARALMSALGIAEADLVDVAYVDLLERAP